MYLIIGSGRSAKHFSHYFCLKNIDFCTWNRRTSDLACLTQSLAKTAKVLLLISDSNLNSFYESYLQSYAGKVIHTSGALDIPGMISAHPLMTFGPNLYELKTYEQMAFALGPGISFSELFPELANPSFVIKPQEKSLYHAWAVYGGNFATLLWKEALAGLKLQNVPQQAIATYFQQILTNALAAPSIALTGPLARRDFKTIDAHLAVLPEPAHSIYQSFVDAYIPEPTREITL
jgi:predicted short-subunit dehydrogenase-like oxidoreductase (DUF2520 family)